MSQEKWGPDVEEVREQNRLTCKHLRQGDLYRNVGAGWPMIGCHREAYWGCLDCKRDLSAGRLAQKFREALAQQRLPPVLVLAEAQGHAGQHEQRDEDSAGE